MPTTLPKSAFNRLLLATTAVALVAGLQTSTVGATTAGSYVAMGDS